MGHDRHGSSSWKRTLGCIGGAVLLSVAAIAGWTALTAARFEAKSRELMSVVDALERHENQRGHYPRSLIDLVPDYLSEPPPKLTYAVNPRGQPHDGGRDRLVVGKWGEEQPGYELDFCFTLNRCIVFLPGGDYPDSGNGFYLSEVLDSGWALYST